MMMVEQRIHVNKQCPVTQWKSHASVRVNDSASTRAQRGHSLVIIKERRRPSLSGMMDILGGIFGGNSRNIGTIPDYCLRIPIRFQKNHHLAV